MENQNTFDRGKAQHKNVDLFSPEMEEKIRREGQIFQRKIEPIRGAEQATETRIIETRLPDGTSESTVTASPGDWIITGAKGEKFVFKPSKFESLYKSVETGTFVPRERKIIAIRNPFNESVRIVAPWSTAENPAHQDGSEKCYFIISLDESGQFTADRYIIGDEELLNSNYTLFKKT